MKQAWMYDEFVHTGTDFSDIKKVEAYDAKMSKFRDYGKESELILDALEITQDDTLLEIGTGTGHFARAAAGRCKRVYAADVSKPMLEYARSKAEKEGISNIEWVHAGFLSCDFHGIKFDGIVSNAALHHLPDLWKAVALGRVYGSLKPGGRFFLGDVVFSCGIGEIEPRAKAWIDGYEAIDKELHREAAEHLKKEYSTFSWVLEGMLDRAGFGYRILADSNNFMAYLCTRDWRRE